MNHFLYLRGKPGVGKITVAKLLEAELGWKLLWFHDIKNAVFNIVQEHRIPRLMDAVTTPIIEHLLKSGQNIVYVRSSPDKETVESVQALLANHPEYSFHAMQLDASRGTLLKRVAQRDDPYRISNEADLDAYLQSRPIAAIAGEHLISTDLLSAEEVAHRVINLLQL